MRTTDEITADLRAACAACIAAGDDWVDRLVLQAKVQAAIRELDEETDESGWERRRVA